MVILIIIVITVIPIVKNWYTKIKDNDNDSNG